MGTNSASNEKLMTMSEASEDRRVDCVVRLHDGCEWALTLAHSQETDLDSPEARERDGLDRHGNDPLDRSSDDEVPS